MPSRRNRFLRRPSIPPTVPDMPAAPQLWQTRKVYGKNGSGSIAIANVWSIWSDLDNGPFKFPRSMMNTPLNCPTGTEIGCNGQLTSGVGMNTSNGYGNYNAGFVTLKMSNWHGLTMQSNFTYGKALGTGSEVQATSQFTVPDAYNLRAAYGPQVWDRKFLYNLWMVYQLPFYQGQKGFVGHLAGGWSIAPIFVTGSGIPVLVLPRTTTINLSMVVAKPLASQTAAISARSRMPSTCAPRAYGGNSRHNNPTVPASGPLGIGSNWYGPSQFRDPAAIYGCFRNPILGIDKINGGGGGVLRGLPFWNVDLSIKKNIRLTERFSMDFTAIFANVFNHNQMGDPLNVLGDVGDWGGLGGFPGVGQANSPRSMEFGLRFSF